MSRAKNYSSEEKYEIIRIFEEGLKTLSEISSLYKINRKTLYEWKLKYQKFGLNGLEVSTTWRKYSKELKEEAVMDYLSGNYSLRDLELKYGLSGNSVLRGWIKKYNGHRELNATAKGQSLSMTKGRTTTWKERIEIVQYCLSHNKDYQKTSEIYQISYQQVYQWVQKYNAGEEDALRDRRGRKKEEDELSAEEKIKLAMRKLEIENERLRAENAFLKKLEELERRRF